jgi:hypothetical protein
MAAGEVRGFTLGFAQGFARGLIEGWVNSLLFLLELRFPPGASPELVEAIRGNADLERVKAWFDAALSSGSLDTFRKNAGL